MKNLKEIKIDSFRLRKIKYLISCISSCCGIQCVEIKNSCTVINTRTRYTHIPIIGGHYNKNEPVEISIIVQFTRSLIDS